MDPRRLSRWRRHQQLARRGRRHDGSLRGVRGGSTYSEGLIRHGRATSAVDVWRPSNVSWSNSHTIGPGAPPTGQGVWTLYPCGPTPCRADSKYGISENDPCITRSSSPTAHPPPNGTPPRSVLPNHEQSFLHSTTLGRSSVHRTKRWSTEVELIPAVTPLQSAQHGVGVPAAAS